VVPDPVFDRSAAITRHGHPWNFDRSCTCAIVPSARIRRLAWVSSLPDPTRRALPRIGDPSRKQDEARTRVAQEEEVAGPEVDGQRLLLGDRGGGLGAPLSTFANALRTTRLKKSRSSEDGGLARPVRSARARSNARRIAISGSNEASALGSGGSIVNFGSVTATRRGARAETQDAMVAASSRGLDGVEPSACARCTHTDRARSTDARVRE
jgi:hypothetical protein